MDIFFGILNSITQVFFYTWWLVLPIFLFVIAWKLYLIYIRLQYVKTIEWSMVELKIPENILKTPKSMEQIFAALAGAYSFGFSTINVYIEGQVESWISFELVGVSGGVHFYVYFPTKLRNLLESAIYSQYPDAEIHPAEDYTKLVPSDLPNKQYDLWGTDLILSRESYYPIKTYPSFEETIEERRVDPIAAITEAMSSLKEDEMIWIQVLISPTADMPPGKIGLGANPWQKEGEEKIEDLAGRPKAKKQKSSAIFEFGKNLVLAPSEPPVWGAKKEEAPAVIKFLHPGEQEIVKSIANKISKFGFETDIRWIYLDRRDSFSRNNISTIMGTFHQFRAENLNSFRPNKKTMTLKTGWMTKIFPSYKKFIELSRKKKIFRDYIERRFGRYNKIRPEKFSILNTEELATVYHFPLGVVSAPKLKRLEAKKGGPPTELPIES